MIFKTLFRRVPERWQQDEFADEERALVFVRYLAWTKSAAYIAGAIGGLLGALFIGYAIYLRPDRFRVRLILFPIMTATIASYMVTGAVILFAPYAFFASQRGREYLWEIGTHNVFVARVLVLIALLLGCGFIGVVVWFGLRILEFEGKVALLGVLMEVPLVEWLC